MSKVQPIPKELWGALGLVSNHLEFAQAATGDWNPRLTNAIELLKEYQSCFRADGEVSQRGEVPQAWNRETVFTPHRAYSPREVCYNQLTFDFDFEPVEKTMIKCPICSGKGYRQRTDKKTNRQYRCESCDGTKEVEHPFANEKETIVTTT